MEKRTENGMLVFITAVFICLAAYFSYQLYLYYHPGLEMSMLHSDSFPVPVIAMKESVFGMSKETDNDLRNFTEIMTQFQEMIIEKYEKSIKLDYDIAYENGKTIIVYSGTACDKVSKNVVDVNEEVVLDFIVELRE